MCGVATQPLSSRLCRRLTLAYAGSAVDVARAHTALHLKVPGPRAEWGQARHPMELTLQWGSWASNVQLEKAAGVEY